MIVEIPNKKSRTRIENDITIKSDAKGDVVYKTTTVYDNGDAYITLHYVNGRLYDISM